MNKPVAQSEFQTPRVTAGPLPASRKVFVAGDLHPDIAVPVREIDLHPSANEPPVMIRSEPTTSALLSEGARRRSDTSAMASVADALGVVPAALVTST